MSKTMIIIKVDEDLKEQFKKNCTDMGTTMTKVFIKTIKDFNSQSTSKK